MAGFDPSQYVSQAPNELAWAEQRRQINDGTNRSIREAHGIREENRRYDQETAINADKENRRRQEFDISHGQTAGYLEIAQAQEQRASAKAEADRRRLISSTAFEAMSKADSVDELEAIAHQLGFSEGIAFRPAPGAAGSQTKPGEQEPVAAPPGADETIGDAAARFEDAALAFGRVEPGKDVAGVVGQPPMDPSMDLGVTQGPVPKVDDYIAGKYTPEQIEAAREVVFSTRPVPFGEIEADAHAREQEAVIGSFQKRVMQLRQMGLPPEQMAIAVDLAAQTHGVPTPPMPQPQQDPNMPPPPPGMEHGMVTIPPEVAQIAGAPPEVPLNIVAAGSKAGALEAYDLKTGEPMFAVDMMAIKQARRDRQRKEWDPLIQSIDNPDDKKKAQGAIESYIATGDKHAMEILHWMFQKDAAAAKAGINPYQQEQLELSHARLDQSKKNADNRVVKEMHNAIRSTSTTFAKQYDIANFNKEMKGLGKTVELLADNPSSMDQRVAVSTLVTSLYGKMASNGERTFVTAAGLKSKVDEVVNFLSGSSELSPAQVQAVKDLNIQMTQLGEKQREVISRNLYNSLKNSRMVMDFGSQLGKTEDDYKGYARQEVDKLMNGSLEEPTNDYVPIEDFEIEDVEF